MPESPTTIRRSRGAPLGSAVLGESTFATGSRAEPGWASGFAGLADDAASAFGAFAVGVGTGTATGTACAGTAGTGTAGAGTACAGTAGAGAART